MPCLRLSFMPRGIFGLCARPSRTASMFLLVAADIDGAVGMGRVFRFHLAALFRFLVAMHGADFVHRAIDGMRIVSVFRAELVLQEFRHGLVVQNLEVLYHELEVRADGAAAGIADGELDARLGVEVDGGDGSDQRGGDFVGRADRRLRFAREGAGLLVADDVGVNRPGNRSARRRRSGIRQSPSGRGKERLGRHGDSPPYSVWRRFNRYRNEQAALLRDRWDSSVYR